MLGVAVAVGVCCTFGSPFGAIIFSIEVTASYYMVSSLWKAYFCCTVALIVQKILWSSNLVASWGITKYERDYLNHEIIFFIILGLLSGKIAGQYNSILSKMVFFRVKLRMPFISHRWKWCLSVGLVIALLSYPVPFMHYGDKKFINMFFSELSFSKQKGGSMFTQPSELFNLLIFVILKFIFNILSLSSPVAGGSLAPTLVFGAGIGRIYGYFLNKFFLTFFGIHAIKCKL